MHKNATIMYKNKIAIFLFEIYYAKSLKEKNLFWLKK